MCHTFAMYRCVSMPKPWCVSTGVCRSWRFPSTLSFLWLEVKWSDLTADSNRIVATFIFFNP